MPRFNDLEARTADLDHYPQMWADGVYDPAHDDAYEWRYDDRMHPTGIFPRNDGQDIDHYQPFGILDFRLGAGEGQYYPQEEHYAQDRDGRVFNTEDY